MVETKSRPGLTKRTFQRYEVVVGPVSTSCSRRLPSRSRSNQRATVVACGGSCWFTDIGDAAIETMTRLVDALREVV